MAHEYTIKIRFKRIRNGNYGHAHRDGDTWRRGIYTIDVNNTVPLYEQIGTLFHEFTHVVFWLMFSDIAIDEVKEHKVCDVVDMTAMKAVKRYMGK